MDLLKGWSPDRQYEFIRRQTSRKWFAFLALVVISTALLVRENITAEIWENVISWTFAVFVGGNVAQKYVERGSDK